MDDGNRWRSFARGTLPSGFNYNSPDGMHRFWVRYNRATGRYEAGVGTTVGQSTVLQWTDPNPLNVGVVSANVYCCGSDRCQERGDADPDGYFCFCTGGSSWGACSGGPVTTAAPSPRPTFAPTPSPTFSPTFTPTDRPTRSPTQHPCDSGNHGCDPLTTYCRRDTTSASGYGCSCRNGFTPFSPPRQNSCRATVAPTMSPTTLAPTTRSPTHQPTHFPTALPTFHPCVTGQHNCGFGTVCQVGAIGSQYTCSCYIGYDRVSRTQCVRRTLTPTQSVPTPSPTAPPPPTAQSAVAATSSGSDSDGGSNNVTIAIIVCSIAVLIAAVYAYMSMEKKGTSRNATRAEASFDNPLYNASNSPQETVEADASGYMDVGPSN